jgi:hypothetical protein
MQLVPPATVSAIPRLTGTPSEPMSPTSGTRTTGTARQSSLLDSPTLDSLSVDSHARLSALLASAVDLMKQEGLYFLTSHGFLRTSDPAILYSKTLRVYLVMTLEKLSEQFLGFSPTWGIAWNGAYLTAKISEFPRTGNGCTLSDILEDDVAGKYFLSDTAAKKILSSSRRQLHERLEVPMGE